MEQPYGLSEFMPFCSEVNSKAPNEVVLEDLRRGFSKPLIYDIKLGRKTVSSKELKVAGTAKPHLFKKDIRLHLADNLSSSAKRGYRFVGCSASSESRTHLGKHPDEMIEDLRTHLSPRDILFVIREIERIRGYFRTKEGTRFEIIGASLLIVAESDPKLPDDKRPLPKVKLIDFAHSHMLDKNGIFLSNGILHTRTRKIRYQRGLRHGLVRLAKDLRH